MRVWPLTGINRKGSGQDTPAGRGGDPRPLSARQGEDGQERGDISLLTR